jgi:CHAT domain-containing protein/Tfp pilus assembly protein PilF
MGIRAASCVACLLCLSALALPAQARNDDEFERLAARAESLVSADDFAGAVPVLERMRELRPGDLAVIEGLASAYVSLPDERPSFSRALPCLEEAERRGSESSSVYYNLACAYSSLGRADDAILELEKAMYLGFWELDWATEDEDLALLRDSGWWEKLEERRSALKSALKSLGDLIDRQSEFSPDKRIKLGERAEKALAELAPGRPLDGGLAFMLCAAYHEKGELARALDRCELSLRNTAALFGEAGLMTAIVLERKGMILGDKGERERGIECREKAVAIKERILDPMDEGLAASRIELSAALNAYGTALTMRGEPRAALPVLEKALSLQLEHPGFKEDAILAQYSLVGMQYFNCGDNGKAASVYEQAMRRAQANPEANAAAIGTLLFNLGQVYSAMGDAPKAASTYEKALAYRARAFGETSYQAAECYMQLGVTRCSERKYGASVDSLERALGILTSVSAGGAADPELVALSTYMCRVGLGSAYMGTGDLERATASLEEAARSRPGGEVLSSLMASYSLGLLHFVKGENEKAAAALEEGLAAGGSLLSDANRASFLFGLGMIYDADGDSANARDRFERALACWTASDNYQTLVDGAWTIAKTCLSKDPELAFEALTVGTGAVERARRDLASARTGLMAKSLPLYYAGVDLSLRRGDAIKAFEYSEALRSRGFLDQLGTEAALKLEGVGDEDRSRVADLVSLVDRLRRELERLNGLSAGMREAGSLSAAESALSAAEKELAAIDERLGRRLPKYAELRDPRPIDSAGARAWCGKGRAVLEYVLWDPSLESGLQWLAEGALQPIADPSRGIAARLSSYCLVLTEAGVEAVRLDGDYDCAKAIRELRRLIGQAGKAEDIEGLRNELYAKLLVPALAKLPAGTKDIVIVPDGILSGLPFDILRPDAASPDFGSSCTLCFSPSVSVSALRSASPPRAARPSLALGGGWYDPDRKAASRGFSERGYDRGLAVSGVEAVGGDDRGIDVVKLNEAVREAKGQGAGAYFASRGFRWHDIPGTEKEVRDIAAVAFGGGLAILSGKDASESSLKRLSSEGKLKDFDMIHLACHGYFDAFIPEMSSVVLSEVSGLLEGDGEDGYLTVPEVAALDLDARMVCLSACSTGLAKLRRGDGMVGLVRSFLVAGSRNVGVSLWNVDDDATREFMTRVYAKVIGGGLGFPRAYREVKDEFRREPKWSHPYYWAAFAMYE